MENVRSKMWDCDILWHKMLCLLQKTFCLETCVVFLSACLFYADSLYFFLAVVIVSGFACGSVCVFCLGIFVEQIVLCGGIHVIWNHYLHPWNPGLYYYGHFFFLVIKDSRSNVPEEQVLLVLLRSLLRKQDTFLYGHFSKLFNINFKCYNNVI